MQDIQSTTTSPALLTKALLRAAEQLGLGADLPSLLSIDSAAAASLQSGARALEAGGAEWTRALQLVGMFRTLVLLLGGAERARTWLTASNQALSARPIDLLRTPDADRVHRYLSAVQKNELRMPPTSSPMPPPKT